MVSTFAISLQEPGSKTGLLVHRFTWTWLPFHQCFPEIRTLRLPTRPVEGLTVSVGPAETNLKVVSAVIDDVSPVAEMMCDPFAPAVDGEGMVPVQAKDPSGATVTEAHSVMGVGAS